MNRRRLFAFGWYALARAALPLPARGDDHGQGKGKDKGKGKGHGNRYFRDGDAVYLRQYYSGPVDLPPGLRKKYYRTGQLPPGWEKGFRPFPAALVQRLPPPPPYCERGYVDGYAVVYDRRTRIIVDIVDLIAAATGR